MPVVTYCNSTFSNKKIGKEQMRNTSEIHLGKGNLHSSSEKGDLESNP